MGSIVIAIAITACASQAPDDEVDRRTIPVRFEQGRALVDLDSGDRLDDALAERLTSGVPQTLTTRVEALGEGRSRAEGARDCRITYDLWRRTYRVVVDHGPTEELTEIDAVADRCLALRSFPVGTEREWAALSGERVELAVAHELNPMSSETVVRTRRWLTYPDGSARGAESFFGSLVGLFVTRGMGEPERTIEYRSAEPVSVP